jgi:cold shock CspA family protein
MAQGTVTRLAARGYGFIDYGTGVAVFFHGTALENADFVDLRKGDRVEFEVEQPTGERGPRATRVWKIGA